MRVRASLAQNGNSIGPLLGGFAGLQNYKSLQLVPPLLWNNGVGEKNV